MADRTYMAVKEVARIEFRATSSGRQQAIVNGEPIEGEPGQSAQDAAVAAVAVIAARRGTGKPRQIRAMMVDEKMTGYPVIITEDGTVKPDMTGVEDVEEPRTRASVKARKEKMAGALAASQPKVLRMPRLGKRRGASKVAAPTRTPAITRSRMVVAVAVLLVLGAVAWAIGSLRTDGAEQLTSGTYPGAAPQGWSSQARWVSPRLLREAGPVAVAGDRAVMVTADRKVLAVDAMTGEVAWSADLPDGQVKTPLAPTAVDGDKMVAIQTGRTLAWWSLADGKAGSAELPEQGMVSFLGDAPLVGMDAATVAVIKDGKLARASVPAGALALAARADGRVTAASSAGWWHLAPGQAPAQAQPLEVPDPASAAPTAKGVIVGYVGGSVVTAWPADASGKAHVAVYKDDSTGVWLSFRGPIFTADPTRASQQTWTPSPSRTWGVLSRTLVDVKGGRVEDLGNWTTDFVGSDRALGKVAGKPAQVGPQIERSTADAAGGFPEVEMGAGAVVRSRQGDAETVYLLPADQ